MDAILHIMAYLGLHHNAHFYPDIDDDHFTEMDCKESYGKVEGPIHLNFPNPLGKPVDACLSKAILQGTNRPDVLANTALVGCWHSKCQDTIETGVFHAKFVAMEMRVDTLTVF